MKLLFWDAYGFREEDNEENKYQGELQKLWKCLHQALEQEKKALVESQRHQAYEKKRRFYQKLLAAAKRNHTGYYITRISIIWMPSAKPWPGCSGNTMYRDGTGEILCRLYLPVYGYAESYTRFGDYSLPDYVRKMTAGDAWHYLMSHGADLAVSEDGRSFSVRMNGNIGL